MKKPFFRFIYSVDFHRGLLLAATILFVFFGIFPLARTLTKKFQLMVEFRQLQNSLYDKTQRVRETIPQLKEVEKEVKYLENSLVADVSVQDYLVDLVIAASKAGFSVTKFTPKRVPGSVNISVTLVGLGNVAELIEAIEGLRRVTKVEEVSYSMILNEAGRRVRISIQIFTGEPL